MQLADYFEFEKFDRGDSIYLKGTRIDIEHLLKSFIAGESPECIHARFRQYLTLEQVYATITYYLHNTAELHVYLEKARILREQLYQEYLQQEPSEVVKRLRAIAAEEQRSTAGKT